MDLQQGASARLEALQLLQSSVALTREGQSMGRRDPARPAAWRHAPAEMTPGLDLLAQAVVGDAVPLVADDAAFAARLFNAGGRRRGTLADCLIAATAIPTGAALATTNPADFKRLETSGLILVD